MAFTKLQIYNRALRLLALPRLSTISDNMPTAFELDDAWSWVPTEVLEAGAWDFATETLSSTSVTPASLAGYAWAHARPADLLRIIKVSNTADFAAEADYRVEGVDYISTQDATVYIRYVSNDLDDDSDIPYWPAPFVSVVAARLALEVCPILRPADARAYAFIEAKWRAAVIDAQQQQDMDKHMQHRRPDFIPASAAIGGATNGN